MVRVFLDQLGHAVVGDPRQLDRLLGRGIELDRRRRQGEHLLVFREHLDDPEPDVQVVKHRHTPASLADVLEIASDSFDAFGITGRGDVGKDVDLAHQPPAVVCGTKGDSTPSHTPDASAMKPVTRD
jgi:hypothetical protein